jgi:hypothetical protein
MPLTLEWLLCGRRGEGEGAIALKKQPNMIYPI